MAVTIKLKNASGSDPSASDLVVGEVAIRTDNGKLFTKKDNGSVAEITGGGGIDDGDKGDITVSNSGGTFTIDNGVVNNAKVASDAAIDGSKIDPTFTSNITISRDHPRIIFTDTDQNPDYLIDVNGGHFLIHDATNGADKIKVNSDGHIDITPNTDFAAGIDVTGNITVSGTVDGRDIATDGSKLDGIASGATNVTNTNQLTNGAGFITATLTNEQVQDIVGGMLSGNTETGITVTYQDGDGTIDFVVASQTDNNFTDADHSKLDGIAAGATNVTNTNQLTNGAGFITATLTNEQVQDIVGGMVTGNTESGITVTYQDGDGTLDFSVASQTDQNFTTTLKNKLDGIAAGANNITNNNQLTNGAGYITADSTKMPLSGGEFTGNITTHDVIPDGNNSRNLGSSSKRFANLFVNDMHFANSPENPNKVDNTWGDWTLQEGEDQIYMLNNRNGKKYKMNLTEIV